VTSYQNPFRARASEQQRDLLAFLRNYGTGVLDLLPDALWDRPLVVRSAPGGGKTSLMRLMTIDSLKMIHGRRDDLEGLASRLSQLGVLGDDGPTRLGVLVGFDRSYRALVQAGVPDETAVRIFFRLLDARVAVAVVRALLVAHELRFPEDARLLRFDTAAASPSARETIDRLGGDDGESILKASRQAEDQILGMLDSLLPVAWGDLAYGHVGLYSLRLLGDSQLTVDGRPVAPALLIMFDDGHELAPIQRTALLGELKGRDLGLSRWYAERFEAMSAQELLSGDAEGRDYEILEIEAAARGGLRSRNKFRFEKFFHDVGNRRAGPTLRLYGEDSSTFTEFLETEADELVEGREREILDALRQSVANVGDAHRYDRWLSDAEAATNGRATYDAALRWRELAIAIARDQDRNTVEMFDFELEESDEARLLGSNVREAAALFLAREFRLPYYHGPETLAKLGSQNIEQYLSVSGELFEEMLGDLTLNRRPKVSAKRQEAVIRRVSERYWLALPRRVPHGRDVQTLLVSIVSMARRETFRPTAPYAPGVTGIALSMADREELLDPERRARIPGADRLFAALASAISYNVLSAELDRSVKGDRFMVMYLNRLLAPRFWLPLGRGGFRERRLPVMAAWMTQPDAEDVSSLELDLGLA
jgi:hypothetical protein